jgi:hypothetical protein
MTETYTRDDVRAWLRENASDPDLGPVLTAALELLDPPKPEPRVIPEVDGLLTCPDCGGREFKENGSHPCDWDFDSQDAEAKALVFAGEFEWYDGDGNEFECLGCGAIFDDLADGWVSDYT